MAGNKDLIAEYNLLHGAGEYGTTSVKNIRFIRPEIRLLRPRSILDYGCGQSRLLDQLNLGFPCDMRRYDPAIPQVSQRPDSVFDLLINVDVLEHIEEADLDLVLSEMRSLCRHALIIVDTRPAGTLLSDGRNAHVTLKPHAWWQERIERHFGPVFPIKTVRRSRAGYRSWPRKPGDTPSYHAMRAVEDVQHYLRRAVSRG